MLKKNFLSSTVILLALSGLGLGMTVSRADAATVSHVTTDHVVLHTGPATTYKTITTVPVGAKVQVNGCLSNKTWCSVRYNGRVGWAPARYVNVNNVPMISFTKMPVKAHSTIKAQKNKGKQTVSESKTLTLPQKIRKNIQELYRTDVILDSTGVKKRDERTILNPSPKAQGVSVEHVNAYNPFFPDNVNFKNFERNETRYRIVTYPAPQR
ncbi:SH3 domain-containing protein [Bartonella sp. 220]|uniref:SH3 domain-containing protein n=1 Tax=Bartonella sp. 220B TaxID=2967260 RepID=UPI0022A916F5|nr:SH3 domain-containing protein [Bartonella sp. 220B]MCZ2159089.1 SH3 domain-containing protein [Bartonella sp. 220B]